MRGGHSSGPNNGILDSAAASDSTVWFLSGLHAAAKDKKPKQALWLQKRAVISAWYKMGQAMFGRRRRVESCRGGPTSVGSFWKFTSGLILTAVVVVFTGETAATVGATPKRPNLLFLFADDQCYETLDPAGHDEVDTPHLDRLVRQGLYFTHAYNQGSWTGAVCVASRTMLNTGRFLWHAHRVWKTSEKERQAGRWWSEYLKQAGYDTYMTGKWHVPAKAERAFDFVAHVRPGMPRQTPEGYNRPIPGQPDPWKPWAKRFGGYWKGGKHWSEVLADDAIAFLQQAAQRDKPFFMYLAFNAPHDPRQSPKEYVDRYPLDRVTVPENYLPEYPFNEAIGCGRWS